jgi:hypothetical protein
MPDTIQVKTLDKEPLAKEIANLWDKWQQARLDWLNDKKELRDYLFATDTRKTSNSKLPWKNSTVTPKLTQLRDNLHANYMAALFPNEDWFIWDGDEKEGVMAEKKKVIQAYMKNKLKHSKFELLVSQLVYDYIDYGNVIAGHEYVKNIKNDEQGNPIVLYIGPRAFRVSPLDVVFDPTASSFDASPMIHRTVKSLGELLKDVKTKPGLGYDQSKIDICLALRSNLRDYGDAIKQAGYTVDGFRTLEEYYLSNNVELLHFWGDIYDKETNTLHEDKIITVLDRTHILRIMDNPSWLGNRPYKHCGWRLRPDNLWAQGPLDQLVGMQYRIDHLENLRADVFDQIAHPVVIIKGDTVEDFVFGPGAEYHVGEEGDVKFERPDANALAADMQIHDLMNKMEELAGAPKQAAGIRTPGEKTKYEVQVLENGAGRIFQAKVSWFEKNIIEPLINSMLEESRRHLQDKDSVKIIDPDTGAADFMDITKDDITAKGKLYPIGARHFAEQAKFVQDLATTLQTVGQLPTIAPHLSGKQMAKALEENLGWAKWKIYAPNIAIAEQKETKALMNTAEDQLAQEAATPANPQPGDDVATGSTPPQAQ